MIFPLNFQTLVSIWYKKDVKCTGLEKVHNVQKGTTEKKLSKGSHRKVFNKSVKIILEPATLLKMSITMYFPQI